METQHQIKRTLSLPENVAVIRQLAEDGDGLIRTALADKLCERLGFLDSRGKKQLSTCLKALRDLEKTGSFSLPPRSGEWGVKRRQSTPRLSGRHVPLPQGVPPSVGAVQGLELVLVESEKERLLWNDLMHQEHPRGAGRLVGHQLRYLVGSDHGWLGALGFAASALHLRDREAWIGWDSRTRCRYLHRIIGLSRFLVRGEPHCRNLASHVLGLCLGRFGEDFEARYGFRPWLVETFVEPPHLGTCFKASNWQRIGQTQGRGRQDRELKRAESVKEIYVYVLEPAFRETMGVTRALPPGYESPPALGFDEGLDDDDWAASEFGGARLGNKKRTARLVASAAAMARQPGKSFCNAAKGNWAAVKGHYRFIDTPDESAVTMEKILLPHRERTVGRMKAHDTVLCIQDGSDLNFSGLEQCKGLGVIGTNQTDAKSCGLHLHSTLVVSRAGLPLGVLRSDASAPELRAKDDTRRRCAMPIEEKASFRWIEGLRDCRQVARRIPDTRVVVVMDRDADFFELFEEQRRDPSVDLLVRVMHNRSVSDGTKLFDAISETPVRARISIHVQRQSARPKKSKQKARPARRERTANVVLRYQQVEIRPPKHLGDRKPISLWHIEVIEEEPPADVEPLRWNLFTTIPINSPQKASESLSWYCFRWRIEDWHRVLKSGCCIQDLAHHTADRLRRAIAINLVISWRIMLMTLLGREQPELPAEILFTDLELEVLAAVAKKNASSPP